MSKAYDILSESLQEVLADVKSEKPKLIRHKRTIEIEPLHDYSAQEIKRIRVKTGLSQLMFAQYFGVSVKTVEAWESGRNHPSGPSSRLLSLLDTYGMDRIIAETKRPWPVVSGQ